MTAPTTPGTYYYNVWCVKGPTSAGSTQSVGYSITVPAPTVSYTITASADTGGSITPSGAVSVTSGGSQKFAIAAASGYQIADVVVDGASKGAVASYDFTNVTANHTIAASFKTTTSTTTSYTITASADTGGSITPSGAVSVTSGGSQKFAIAAASGYQIADVVVDGASKGAVASYDFTNVTANHTIAASFKTTTSSTTTSYTITASAGANGSISPSGAVTVTERGKKTFKITPASGYRVADVLVDGRSVGAVTKYTFSNVTGDHTITAGFESRRHGRHDRPTTTTTVDDDHDDGQTTTASQLVRPTPKTLSAYVAHALSRLFHMS